MASPKIVTPKMTYTCYGCGAEQEQGRFYKSSSIFYKGVGRLPVCKDCLRIMYDTVYEEYKNSHNMDNAYPLAWKRICMGLNIYFNQEIWDACYQKVLTDGKEINTANLASAYMIVVNRGNVGRDYSTTLKEESDAKQLELQKELQANKVDITIDMINFWGEGFQDDDYRFLQRQYDEWVTRHECDTKAQEEIFKTLCFLQLERQKARREGRSTKDLDKAFNDYLSTAKLQPKQNASEALSKSQTFGTLINKWENERPIPEIDDEFKDVDRIGRYIDVFFKGHLAKMMGIKNGYSDAYLNYMKKYTVTKPEYDEDEESDVIFDAIFGGQGGETHDEN